MYSTPTRVVPFSVTTGATGALAYTGGPLTLLLLAAFALMVVGVLALRSSRIVAR